MANKIEYPKRAKRMLQVRDCTVAICASNNPGSVLLSTFLFWYDHPRNGDVYDGDFFTVCRTQADIAEQACSQIDVKTVHDTAVPLLSLLGYLTVKEKMNGNIYKVNMKRVMGAFAAYDQGDRQLKAFLKSASQLESSLIEITPDELEAALINKRRLYLQLERVLIRIREDSNCKRGRKPRQQAAPEGENPSLENSRESRENSNKRVSKRRTPRKPSKSADAHPPASTNNKQSSNDLPVVTPATGNKKNAGNEEKPAREKKPTLYDQLSEQEKQFWDLWCHIDQYHNKPQPALKASAIPHIRELAPCITTQEQVDSLVKYSREKLRKQLKRPTLWVLELGNIAGKHFLEWDHEQQQRAATPTSGQPAPEDENKLILWTRRSWEEFDDLLENYWYYFEYMSLKEARQYEYDTYGPLVPRQRMEIEMNLKLEAEGKKQRPLAAVAS